MIWTRMYNAVAQLLLDILPKRLINSAVDCVQSSMPRWPAIVLQNCIPVCFLSLNLVLWIFIYQLCSTSFEIQCGVSRSTQYNTALYFALAWKNADYCGHQHTYSACSWQWHTRWLPGPLSLSIYMRAWNKRVSYVVITNSLWKERNSLWHQ